MLRRAHAHRGASFVEILQNCNVFNDGAFDDLTDKARKAEHTLVLEHGKPLIFGSERDKGIRLRGFVPEVVTPRRRRQPRATCWCTTSTTRRVAAFLSRLGPPDFPTPIGVLYAVDRPCYDEAVNAQIAAAKERAPADLGALLRRGEPGSSAESDH